MKKSLSALILSLSVALYGAAKADEGMWLYNEPPVKLLKARYGFDLKPEWLRHLQLSSVRFNNGGSGSFVSADGLVLTNHHVGADALQSLSTVDFDLIKKGFLAHSRAEELPTKDLELNVLYSIEDVTARVKGAVKPQMTGVEAESARRAVMAEIEKESLDATGLRSDVVTLFRGGAYHLYRYKKYTDIRLVFAPEIGIAFFGGDTDNFEYPRYCLDMTLFRVYENGKPVHPSEFLQGPKTALKEGDLTFVSGHPGHTERLNTVAHLEFLRDRRYPTALRFIRRLEILLRTFGERSPENRRRAQDQLFGIQNARKAYLGGLEGLQDPRLMEQKRAHERVVKEALASSRELQSRFGDPFQEIADALAAYSEIYLDDYLVGEGRAFNTRLFDIAQTIFRYRSEVQRPNGERLREYRESNLDSLRQELLSTAPIYADLETAKLADSLSFLMEVRGADDPLVQKVLAHRSPAERAAQMVASTRLFDVSFRRQAMDGAVSDPMIELAESVDEESRRLHAAYLNTVKGPLETAYGKLALLEYELDKTAGYPDATFTLRLAYGPVKRIALPGKEIGPFTTLGGLFEKGDEYEQAAPYTVPASWLRARSKLNLDTPFDFISTPDITGGNSGSPVVDRHGDLVGLIFDGNIQSLVLDFQYEDKLARAVSVDVRAIKEALTKVYGAGYLAEEMGL